MKKKLTITVDADVLPLAKRYAKSKGVSLSSLVEQALRDMAREESQLSRRSGGASSNWLRGALPDMNTWFKSILDAD